MQKLELKNYPPSGAVVVHLHQRKTSTDRDTENTSGSLLELLDVLIVAVLATVVMVGVGILLDCLLLSCGSGYVGVVP